MLSTVSVLPSSVLCTMASGQASESGRATSSQAGLLVSTLDAFRHYQANEAWTWELQALARARAAIGDPEVARSFGELRHDVLSQPRDLVELAEDVRDMRARMRESIQDGDPLKHAAGAMVDIDFVAQLGVLSLAPTNPELLDASSINELLPLLAGAGWLPEPEAQHLAETHLALTRARHLSALSRKGRQPPPDLGESASICARILGLDAPA